MKKKLTDKHTRKYQIKHNFYVTAAAGLQLANVWKPDKIHCGQKLLLVVG